jgi:hypothetical protein
VVSGGLIVSHALLLFGLSPGRSTFGAARLFVRGGPDFCAESRCWPSVTFCITSQRTWIYARAMLLHMATFQFFDVRGDGVGGISASFSRWSKGGLGADALVGRAL